MKRYRVTVQVDLYAADEDEASETVEVALHFNNRINDVEVTDVEEDP